MQSELYLLEMHQPLLLLRESLSASRALAAGLLRLRWQERFDAHGLWLQHGRISS